MAQRLTDAAIKRIPLPPEGKRTEVPDALAPGLILRVNDRGRREWLARFRVDGQQRKIALGPYPALGLGAARDMAREVRDQAAAGVDPREARRVERHSRENAARAEAEASKTFSFIAQAFTARECPRLKTGGEIASTIRSHILPAIGGVPVCDLRRRDLVRITDALIDRDLPGAALKVHGVARRVTRWALERDEIEADPFTVAKPPVAKVTRDRVLTDDELHVLWAAWERQGYPFGRMQQLLLLTATRRSEVAAMEWRELDEPDAPSAWMIPAARAKNAEPHVLRLGSQAQELLANLPRQSGAFVFSTTGGARPVSGFSRAKAVTDRICTEIASQSERDPPEAWRLHDLRRTARTGMARLGIADEVAERVLNHVGGSALVRTYNRHRYEKEIGDALERWGREVLRIVGGGGYDGGDAQQRGRRS